ncbi:ClcB-like voltage-gated chloride channel protein [Thiorhodovibrio frisius]|uniref:ClcB-like voltage-gated chloride channel protein n=1 Tax=Thiorhodovibrio frisius TaxID=631362 RepID=UPI001CC166D5|nr:ClcB-like voltage-gated chloride channel protein [Thiorhodovibrio frisius]
MKGVRYQLWLRLMGLLLGFAFSPAPCSAADQTFGPVRDGETLWEISGRLYADPELTSGPTRDQIMLALLEANPDAFSPSCNLNGVLRVGGLLRVPDLEQAKRIDADSARAEVQRQSQEWAEHRRSGQPILCPDLADESRLASNRAETEAEPPVAGEAERGTDDSEGAGSTVVSDTPMPTSDCPATPAAPANNAGEDAIAPVGARAPAWVMTAVLLALMATAMVRWKHRWELGERPIKASTALGAAAQLPKRAVLLLAAGRTELYLLLLMATLAGFFGALVTVIFREGIRMLEWLVSGQENGLVAAAEALAPWQRLLLPVAGGLLAGLILQQIGGRLKGRSTTDYMEAVAMGDGWISVRHSLVKASSSLITVASGGSIGREGAMVQLAAMVASAMGRISRFPRDRLRLLVAAGAAAGLASAYNAPIAATLFVAEIVLGSIALEYIGPLIIAAVIANTTVHEILGYAPVYQIPAFSLVSDWELALYLVLGILAGHLAPAFLSLLERSHHFFGRLPMPLAGRMALGGLVVGAISVYEPQVWGNGYSVVNAVLRDPWAWQALLTVLVLKIISTAATHGSGAVGGAFTPTIFVGAMLGALFGTLVHTLLPDGTATPNAYAVVGMGAMLAGTTHAPLMSILMVFELTMDYQIVLPLMLAVITAHYTASRYTDIRPMYADSLLPRENPV